MKWHAENKGSWPNIEAFLKRDLKPLLWREITKRVFFETACAYSTSGRLKKVAEVGLAVNAGFQWETEPRVRVAGPHSGYSGEFRDGVVHINYGVADSFEHGGANLDYRNAFEMLLLHEMLHFVIDSVGGDSGHNGFWHDPVGYFEYQAYADRALRHSTLGKMED